MEKEFLILNKTRAINVDHLISIKAKSSSEIMYVITMNNGEKIDIQVEDIFAQVQRLSTKKEFLVLDDHKDSIWLINTDYIFSIQSDRHKYLVDLTNNERFEILNNLSHPDVVKYKILIDALQDAPSSSCFVTNAISSSDNKVTYTIKSHKYFRAVSKFFIEKYEKMHNL